MTNFIPSPPPGPSILPGQADPDIDALASELMASNNAPQQQGPTVSDPDIDVLANEAMGVNAQLEQPLPAAANGLQAAPKAGPSIKRRSAAEPTKLTQAPPPTAYEQAGQQFMQGVATIPKTFNRGLDRIAGQVGKTIQQIPVVGPAAQGLAQQAGSAQQEYARDPLGASIAAVANAPRGVLNLVDAGFNTASRQLSQWGPSVHANNPPLLNLAGAYDSIPGIQTLQQAYPAQSATGQSAGASTVPMHLPIPIANPVIRGAVQGGVGGQVLGSLESAGQQARTGPVNYGKAVVEGLPTAALGAGLGAGIGKAAKTIGKGFGKATKAETKVNGQVLEKPTQTTTAPDKPADIVMADGSKFTQEQATAQMRDAATPPEVKEELKSLLRAKDEEFANAGMRPKTPARETAFTKLGRTPTNADFETTFREAFANAKDQAEVKQIQADAFSYMTGKIKGPIAKEMQTKINAVADMRLNALQPKYIKVENGGLGENGDLSAQAAQKSQELMPSKPTIEEVPKTPAEKLDAEEKRLFPYAGERGYGTTTEGFWKPSELTTEQINDSLEFMRDGRTLNDREKLELRGLEQELQRREWRQRQEAENPDAAIKHETPTPEPVMEAKPEEPVTAPIAEAQQTAPTEPKGFYGNTRRLIQGNTGDDVTVKFPTPLERDIFSHASQKLGKQLPADVRSREAAAAELGMTPGEYWEYAKQYANDLKTAAREGRRTNDGFMEAPRAQPQKSLPPTTSPETTSAATKPVVAEAAPVQSGNRFITQKNTEKPGGYVDLIDSSTGEIISSSKRTEAQAAALAAKYNDLATNAPDKLEAELRRGSKNLLDFRKTDDANRTQIVENAKTLPEGHELSEPLSRVADAKHDLDEATARYEASADAFYKHIKATQGTTTKRARQYLQDIEDLTATARKAGSKDLTIEVNNSKKVEPVKAPRFQRGMSPEEAYAMVENLHSEMKAKQEAYDAARKEVNEPFLKSDLGSVNVPSKRGPVNVRAVPKQGSELNALAEELRGPVPDQEYVDRTISNVRKAAATRGIKTRRNQRGSVTIRTGGRKPPPPKTVEESLADGAAQSKEISDWTNATDKVQALLTLRNTFDIAREVSTDLHNELMVGVGKEALAAHGIKFEGPQAALAEASLELEPWTIREGGTPDVDLSSMTDAQLNYLATRKSIRTRMAESVRDELTNLDNEYGSLSNMPNRVRNQYTTLEQLEQSLSGYSPRSGTTEGDVLGLMRNGIYDYVFKWNAAYHSLNLADPFIVGSARVGINRIVAAKALLQMDPTVKAYVKGVPNETPIQQLRKESILNLKTPKGVKAGKFTKLQQGLANIQSRLPDLPSERWNFEDSWLAGVIERGDRIDYEGGGVQYAKDLAAGKLSLDEQIKLFADSMNTAQEITGSGSFGLNKDTVQRVGPLAKAVTLFTSQPLRQSRILSDIITKDMKVDPIDATQRLLAFAAATTFFGGRALLPKESDYLEMSPQVRPFLRGVHDLLDKGQLFQNVPIIGRDLTDKIRYSMVPFLGGVQQNMLAAEIDKLVRMYNGQKWDDAKKAAFYWALSSFAGGGGLEASKIGKNVEAVQAGDKKISAYSNLQSGGFPAKQSTFRAITKKKYDVTQAVKDSLLPGNDPRIGAFIKKARRDKIGR